MNEGLLLALTNMTPAEVREYEPPAIISSSQVFYDPRVPVRDWRLATGRFIGVDDLNPIRERIRRKARKILYKLKY